jgi:anti-sigma factor RsiW
MNDPLLAIAVAEPCPIGAPLLHQLVDGELSSARTREAAEHAQRCPACRDHLHWLELEQQAVREVAAPTARRFVALWGDHLRRKLVAAVTEEAGVELVRAARDAEARRPAAWRRARDYLRQLAGWLGRDELRRVRRNGREAVLRGFAELLGATWPPLVEARRLVQRSPRSRSGSARSTSGCSKVLPPTTSRTT